MKGETMQLRPTKQSLYDISISNWKAISSLNRHF